MAERTTPDRDRNDAEPLLGEQDDVIGGEGGVLVGGEGGPLISLAEHTPEEFKGAREERPLLDD
jgi:hypothetical protein